MIFSISVIPPTLGNDTRAKSMSRCSTSGLKSARMPHSSPAPDRHRRQQPQLRKLRAELLFAKRVLDREGPKRLRQPARFDRLVEVELLMQVDHEVAVGSDALADLFQRLDDLRNARACIEQRSAPAAARRRRRRPRPARPGAAAARAPHQRRAAGPAAGPPARCAARARQDAAVDAIHAPAGGHRRRGALLQAHPLRLVGRDDPLRQTARRVQLDVLTRLAAEELIERHLSALPLISHSARSIAPSACSRSSPGE